MDFSRSIKQLITNMTLMAICTISWTFPSQADLPVMEENLSTDHVTSQVSDVYRLSSGDIIYISVLDEPDYSGEYQILFEGSLALPIIGVVSFEGLTLEEAAQRISDHYQRYIKTPVVRVSLITPRHPVIAVAGEVNSPGTYTIALIVGDGRQSGIRYPTVTKLLELAGGIKQTADLRRIQVRRQQSNGSQQTLIVDLWGYLQTGDLSLDTVLRDQDTIFVPPATNPDLSVLRQLGSANFAIPRNVPRTVSVLGEVSSPGTYSVVGGETGTQGRTSGGLPTVTRAIRLASGLKPSADIQNIEIRRPTISGQEQIVIVNLQKLLQEGDISQDTLVQDGDTIFVPTATEVNQQAIYQLATTDLAPPANMPRTVAVIGQVQSPGMYTIVGGSTRSDRIADGLPTVTTALNQAGGIKPLADLRQIQIRRPTNSGANQIIPVDLWQLLQVGDVQRDLVLQNGDTIIVPTASEINRAEAFQVTAASFSAETIQVKVVGELGQPGTTTGSLDLPAYTTLNQALLAAGGLNGVNSKNLVELIRLEPNGTVSRWQVKPDFSQGINEQTNPLLRDNDIIIAHQSGLTRYADTLRNARTGIPELFTVLRILDMIGILELN